MKQLKDIASYVSDKIDVKCLKTPDYISTDNMLPEKGGISTCVTIPEANRVTQYLPGDVLVSNIRPYFKKIWFSNRIGGCSNDVIVFRVIDENKTQPKFLYYLLSQDRFFDYMMIGSNGTKMPRGNKKLIPEFYFNCFEIASQKKIAYMLSAYDDLIENNQKQIRLLEEAAMRLYKEWFVHLRFPGHETTKIVDGVPEGWVKGQLKDFVEVNAKNLTKDYPYQEMQYIDISSVNCGRIEYTKIYRLADAPGRAKRLANDGDIIWGMVRPNLKAYALILSPTENCVFSTGFSILTPKCVPYTFLYCSVTQDSFISYLVNCTNGSAYPAVKPIHFEEAKIMIPNVDLLEEFHHITNPIFRKVNAIEAQKCYLQQARDKLLPKLMSGEIDFKEKNHDQ
jgi:type I restriction enzyme S subunit